VAAEVGLKDDAAVSRVLGGTPAGVDRHAGGGGPTVEPRVEGELLRPVVEDDGRGSTPRRTEAGWGRPSCTRDRGGGDCAVCPRLGGGTRVTVDRPAGLMDVAGALHDNVGVDWCPHLAILVPSADRVLTALASFYALGACRNGLLLHRPLPGRAERDRAGLTAAGLDVAALEDNGRLLVVEPAYDTDPERWARPWVPVVEDALARGFDAVWFSRFPIGPDEGHLTAALAFDRAWDEAFRGRPAVSLCVYIVDDVDDAARARRVETLAPFHDGVVVPAGAAGVRLVRTRT
jgi:hypothetical protein